MQIVSGSRDRSIKLWNTLGECKFTIGEPDGHSECVSCVRFSPVTTNPIIVSAGWDKLVKVTVRSTTTYCTTLLPGFETAIGHVIACHKTFCSTVSRWFLATACSYSGCMHRHNMPRQPVGLHADSVSAYLYCSCCLCYQ